MTLKLKSCMYTTIMNEFHNTEELCQWLKDLCHLFCRKLDSSMNDYHQKLCELVISYIDENYA